MLQLNYGRLKSKTIVEYFLYNSCTWKYLLWSWKMLSFGHFLFVKENCIFFHFADANRFSDWTKSMNGKWFNCNLKQNSMLQLSCAATVYFILFRPCLWEQKSSQRCIKTFLLCNRLVSTRFVRLLACQHKELTWKWMRVSIS